MKKWKRDSEYMSKGSSKERPSWQVGYLLPDETNHLPQEKDMEIIITGRFGHTSRGRTTAKHSDGHWGDRENANVILDAPGRWHLCTTDGFNRKKSCDVRVAEDGTITGMSGDFTIN